MADNNQPPQPQFLQKRLEATNDPKLYEGLADFNPLGLGFTSLKPEQRQRFEDAGLDAGDFESRGLLGNLFPKWALSDALKEKRKENRTQIKPAIEARNQQYADQQFQMDRAQKEKQQDTQMNFDFGSKMADKSLQGAKELAKQQGKLNLRQTMFNSATNRQGSRMWN